MLMDVDVLVVGSCCTDFICQVPRIPKLGETIHGHNFITAFGGKGANQAVMAARLGASVAMVTKVGNDSFGKDTVKNFCNNNVKTDFVKTNQEMATGVAVVTVDDEGHNAFISVSGANESLMPTDVEEVFSKVTSAKVMSTEMFIRADTCLSALRAAKKRGWCTILNPSPAISSLDPEFYSVSDCICLNQLETKLLTALSVTSVEEAEKASLVLLERGCQKVIITLGKDGVVMVTAEERKPQHIPVTPVAALDTTGAGDCFLGTLAFYLASFPSLSLKEMVHRSNQIAAMSVQSQGAQLSYPWYKDLSKELLT